MGLRCSLLGHDFGDVEVEREREERGSEVVVTITEFETCSRCGDRNIVTENTEVRTAEPAGTEETPSNEGPDRGDSERDSGQSPVPTESADPEADDGIILEEGPESDADRGRGEWPDEEQPVERPGDGADSATTETDTMADTGSDAQTGRGDSASTESEGGFTKATAAPAPGEPVDSTANNTPNLFCPNCGTGSLGDRDSLRPGDICPECQTGYVAERDS